MQNTPIELLKNLIIRAEKLYGPKTGHSVSDVKILPNNAYAQTFIDNVNNSIEVQITRYKGKETLKPFTS